jgi:ABC-type lipoprotein release transport system permease subunit
LSTTFAELVFQPPRGGASIAARLLRAIRRSLTNISRKELSSSTLSLARPLLAVVALAATLVPARRAATVDPAAELK